MAPTLRDLADFMFARAWRRGAFECGSSEEVVDALMLSAIDDLLSLVRLEPEYVAGLAMMREAEGELGDALAVRRFMRGHLLS